MPAADIAWAVDTWQENAEAYEVCEDYYAGDHPLAFATEKFRNTFGPLFQKLRDNLCPAVVEAESDRLYVTGWDGGDAKAATELTEDCSLNRSVRNAVKDSVMQGDGFIIVSESENDAGVQFWKHSPDCVVIEYDDEDDPGKIIRGAKLWEGNDGKWRLNLYYEDAIEKYRTASKVTNGVPNKANRWRSLGADEHGYDEVPIFHFGHDADLGDMGTSILKDVIPLQDALNKSLCDLMVAGEFISFPQRWATGLQIDVDEETGRPRNPPFVPGVDRIWTAAGDVKFGQFQSGDLDAFIKVQTELRSEVCRVSGVPKHLLYLDAQYPNGEALKTSEGRLVKKIEHQQENYDPEMRRMMRLAISIKRKGKNDADVVPVWANAAPHNPLLDAETQLVKQQVGVSKRESLRELQYDDDKINEMMAENDAEAEKQAALAPAPVAVAPTDGPTAFTRNGSPGQPSKPAPQKQQVKKPVPVPMPRTGSGEKGYA